MAVAVGQAEPPAHGFATGFKDQLSYLSSDPDERGRWLNRTERAGARFVHLGIGWPLMVGDSPPADPTNPVDPAYRNFHLYDAAIRDAQERGLDVILALGSAPEWAEAPDRPPGAPLGTWRPDARAYGAFAQAVATRYSGSFLSLPRVEFFQAWSEPNLDTYLTPQYRRRKAASPRIYRRMLNEFYAGVHAAQPTASVITGGTAPYGDLTRSGRMPPLVFWRKVLCLKRSLAAADCPTRPRFDVLAHHPIDTAGGPGGLPAGRNNVSIKNFRLLRRTLRAAERHHTVLPEGRRPIWATEIWWESNPPDRFGGGVGPRKHARFLRTAVRSLRRQGAKVVLNYLIRDRKTTRANRLDITGSGIFFRNGNRKRAFRAWRAVSHG